MNFERKIQARIMLGYIAMLIVGIGIVFILLHERKRASEIEAETKEIHALREGIQAAHRHVARLAALGEGVIGWEAADSARYHALRLRTDSLLQTLKPHCTGYVRPGQIDTLCSLLADKEVHLLHIMEAMQRQEAADSLLVNHLPEVARRATRIRTVRRKKNGLAGALGGKRTVQILPSAGELHAFSDSLVAMQRERAAEMDAYADSLRSRNRALNIRLNRLISDLDGQAQAAFAGREREMAEARALSVRLLTATLSAAIILLFLSYLAIHRELKRNADEKRKREKLIGELERTNEENRELIRLRRNLIQTVTHELRTPLSAISGNAELLLKDEAAGDRIRHAEAVMSSAGRMAGMIDSLLEYFRLDSGKVSLVRKPFRLGGIAETLEVEFAPLAAGKGLAFSIDNRADGIVEGDKGRILGLGANLLSNAIKYTPNGKVSLATRYTGGIFTLTVEDTGTGIKREQQERIFMPFERLGNAAAEDGFGLGLAIVTDTLKLMGGDIEMESEPGHGSRFAIALPLPEAQEVRDGMTGRKPFGMTGRSVLMIDNDSLTLGMVRDMFASCGVDCDICTNVGELVEAIRTKDYDLLITDLKMPDIDGYGVLELLRTSDIGNSRTIPVVVATAAGYVEEKDMVAAGFAALLAKPFSIDELVSVTERCIPKEGTKRISLSPLLAFGDGRRTLERLVDETEKDMREIRRAAEAGDLKALDGWIHHIRSSWMLIKAEQPLAALYDVIHKENPSEEAWKAAVDAVLAQGKLIIDLARKEAERWDG